jgi:hypothetical protein
MPMIFDKGWNGLHLSKLKKSVVPDGEEKANAVGNIARFWKAKTRMKQLGPAKIAELDTKIADLAANEEAKKADPTKKFTPKMAAEKAKHEAERETIQKALDRGKVTAPMVKKFAPELVAGLTKGQPKLLDPVMEQIHNDRLRIADADMLKQYNSLNIFLAVARAKPRFTQDPKVAAMFARAVARDGEPVKVTQGVHQADDPHFDVVVPGDTQQIHIDVTLAKPLLVRSVSYMLGPTKDSGTRRVPPDGAAPVDTV